MVQAAWTGAGDSDRVVVIVDAARGLDDDVKPIIEKLKTAGGKHLLVLNKVDRIHDKSKLLELAAELSKELDIERVFMISALTGSARPNSVRISPPSCPRGRGYIPKTR